MRQRVLALLIVLMAALPSGAKALEVEVIVFQRLGLGEARGEAWPEVTAAGEPGAVRLDDRSGAIAGFQPLSADRLQLGGVFEALARSRNYRPLIHIGWTQPGLGEGRARPVYIGTGGTASATGADAPSGNAIEGTLELAQSRFLHLRAGLVHHRAVPPEFFGDAASRLERLSGSQTHGFRLVETRRMAPGEIHYLDHPLFGVIVQVRASEP
jgi:hypothetical protein